MSRLLHRLGRGSALHPWRTLLLWALAATAVFALGSVAGGVLSHLDGQYVTFAGAIAATPEMAEHGHADAVRLTEALAPWANGRQYLNFAETPVDVKSAYADGVWRQLAGIRSAVDPNGRSWPTIRCRASTRTAAPRPDASPPGGSTGWGVGVRR